MSKKSPRSSNPTLKKAARSPGKNVLMTLTLVPLAVGIILIGAWVLDIEILHDPQAQIVVGIFFFLLSFTASNAIQKKWLLCLGWALLAVADLVTLVWLNLAAQVIAILFGGAGVVLLGVQFFRQYRQGKNQGR